MTQWFVRFWVEEEGQDLIEYSLLITFIAIACLWFLGGSHQAVKGVWTSANSSITVATSAANGGD